MKSKKILAAFFSAIISCSVAFAAAENLWPQGKMPGNACTDKKEDIGKPNDRRISNISTPTLEFFPAEGASGKTGLVVICPGGGYQIVCYDKEGTEVASKLASEGISCLVLKYRVPNNKQAALMDIQRAVRTARANADKWNIDAGKIAVMGFSAGANLSARASTLYGEDSYEKIDEVDKYSAKPDCTILVYPAYCDEPTFQRYWGDRLKRGSSDYNADYQLANDLKVDSSTPPAFIIQTQDDRDYVNASLAYYLALKKAGVPADLHMFSKGGHGFGIRNKKFPVRAWIDLCIDWLKARGFSGGEF